MKSNLFKLSFVLLLVLFSPVLRAESQSWTALQSQVADTYAKGDYSQAYQAAQSSLEVARREFGGSHLNVAVALNQLALIASAQGDYSKAEPYHGENLTDAMCWAAASRLT